MEQTTTSAAPPKVGCFAFESAYRQLTIEQAEQVKSEIMSALGLTSRSSWRKRVLGIVEPKIGEARAIEKIFSRRGVTQVWSIENTQTE